jgi:hypothetical protein
MNAAMPAATASSLPDAWARREAIEVFIANLL